MRISASDKIVSVVPVLMISESDRALARARSMLTATATANFTACAKVLRQQAEVWLGVGWIAAALAKRGARLSLSERASQCPVLALPEVSQFRDPSTSRSIERLIEEAVVVEERLLFQCRHSLSGAFYPSARRFCWT
jgi:hypothetical protein